ncbi:MAG: cell wall biosynthesis glycosyltransferase [Phenylobacterium sp.]
MLSVIVDTKGGAKALPGLLASLVPAAMGGLVREVLVLARDASAVTLELCEDCGAKVLQGDLPAAAAAAKSDRLLVLPADIRLAPGWIEELADHLACGGGDAVVVGIGPGGLLGFLKPDPTGVLVERRRLDGLTHPDLQGLRRKLGPRVPRIG